MGFLQGHPEFFILLDEILESLRVFLAQLLGSLVGFQGQLSLAQQGQGFAEVMVTLGAQKLGFFNHRRGGFLPKPAAVAAKIPIFCNSESELLSDDEKSDFNCSAQ